jgi:hypothetical protein
MTLLLTAAVVQFVKRQRGEGPPPEQRVDNEEEEARELQDIELSTVTSTEHMGWKELAAHLEQIF